MQADADVVGKFRVLLHDRARRAHDELEMRDVVAVVRAEHEEFVLRGRFAVQAVAAIEHENLERRDAVLEREIFHLAEVAAFDRRDVIAVVDEEASVGQLQDFGHHLAIGPAAIEIVLRPCGCS